MDEEYDCYDNEYDDYDEEHVCVDPDVDFMNMDNYTDEEPKFHFQTVD